MSATDFQLDVVERLARIEEKVDAGRVAHESHEKRIVSVERELKTLSIDSAVAKRISVKWAAGIGTGLILVAEVARAWLF